MRGRRGCYGGYYGGGGDLMGLIAVALLAIVAMPFRIHQSGICRRNATKTILENVSSLQKISPGVKIPNVQDVQRNCSPCAIERSTKNDSHARTIILHIRNDTGAGGEGYFSSSTIDFSTRSARAACSSDRD